MGKGIMRTWTQDRIRMPSQLKQTGVVFCGIDKQA